MKNILCLFFACLLFYVPVFLPAQTAAEIEALLNAQSLSYGEAARFVLRAADQVGELSPADAFTFAMEKRWLPQKAESGSIASLDGISLLIMRSFGIKGGIMYSIFRNPHYAYRELEYKDVIQGRADPKMIVSGEQLLFLVSRILPDTAGYDDLNFDINKHLGINAAEDQSRRVMEEAERRDQARVAQLETLAAQINTELAAHAVGDTSARITEQGVTISLSNIQFMANSTELPAAERRKLQEISQILRNISSRMILVSGHTAMAGTAADQMKTSQDRAAAVAAYLVSLGARNPDEVFSQGFGANRPIADNSTPQGMALNRRVEITILEDRR